MARQPDIHDVLPPEKSHRLSKVWNWNEYGYNRSKDDILGNVLKKKLKGSVGQPWNEVYSKLKAELPERLKNWLDNRYYIELNCFEQDGKVYTSEGRDLSYRGWCLYVTDDGILKLLTHKKHHWKREKPSDWITTLDKRKYYLAQDNCWWEIITKPCEPYQVTVDGKKVKYEVGFYSDIIFGSLDKRDCGYKYGEYVYCIKRLQCGKKLCKKLDNLTGIKR
jgi:hypothetical protein